MIIQPNFPSGFVIFCDDVREEINGKLTLVGTYGGEMTVFSEIPAKIPLAVMVRYRVNPDTLPQHVTVRFTMVTKSNQILLLETQTDVPAPDSEFPFPERFEADASTFFELAFATKFAALEIAETCQIKVRAYVGDDEIRLGSLQVKLTPPPSE